MARYEASAATLTWGVALLATGVLGLLVAQLVAAGDHGMSPRAVDIAVLSGLTAVVGLALTLLGVWRAATNIDAVAREVVAAAAVAADSSGLAEAQRREDESRAGREALEQFRARALAAEEAARTERA